MNDPRTCQNAWVLRYKRKLMCADCGYILETLESKRLNLHGLALLAEEEENKEKTPKIE